MIVWKILLLVLCSLIKIVFGTIDPIGLRAASSIRGLKFGAAASIANLRNNVDNGQFNPYIKRNYHLIEPENDLKPIKIWRGENNYDWVDSDWLLGGTPLSVGWAQQNSMEIRGHTLVWAVDKRIPSWLLQQESSITSDIARLLLRDYIYTVVGRYRAKITSWDVINEAVDDAVNGNPFNIRNCFWYRKLGQDFIKYAFLFASQADPQAQLYYNDYNIERQGQKSTNVLQLLAWARSQGATIHGVGLQWHISVSTTVRPQDTYYASAQKFIDSGFDIMITELDVSIPMNGSVPQNPNDLQKQAEVYRSLVQYALYFSPKCRALITWGFTDRYSWIPWFSNKTKGAALPTDENYQPKPAYWKMQEELARNLPNGIYRLTSQAQPDQYLTTYDNGNVNGIHMNKLEVRTLNQLWNLTWLSDGTYRLTSQNHPDRALDAYQENLSVGSIQVDYWHGKNGQKWVFSPVGDGSFRIAPRTVWWRALTIDGTSNVIISDYSNSASNHWIFIKV